MDCHSFPETPFPYEADERRPRPNICLGRCDNTPVWLLDAAEERFLRRGYSVAVDFPYAGCLVPQRFQGDPRVPAIMVEINRRLYLQPAGGEAYRPGDTPLVKPEFERVRNDIQAVMLELAARCEARLGSSG